MNRLSTFVLGGLMALLPSLMLAQHAGFRDVNLTIQGRSIIATVWYPTSANCQPNTTARPLWVPQASCADAPLPAPATRRPLILLSHGYGGNRDGLDWLAAPLAAQGYIVASLDHYGNAYGNMIATEGSRPWRRAGELQALLRALAVHPDWQSRLDTAQVGAAGFSIGAYTVLALGGGRFNFLGFYGFL